MIYPTTGAGARQPDPRTLPKTEPQMVTGAGGPLRDPTEWFIADTHFGDKSVLTPGKNPRPFGSLNEMADEIVKNWTDVVQPDDTVWVLGDIGRDVEVFRDLPGIKHMVGGNCDPSAHTLPEGLFTSYTGCKYLKGLILTHVPVHPSQVNDYNANVHGHLHSKTIAHDRYLNVGVDQTQWRPISRAKVNWALRLHHLRRYPIALPGKRQATASQAAA